VKLVVLIFFLLAAHARAQAPAKSDDRLVEEKELDVVDFQHVKDVLTKDGLMQEALRKKKDVARIQSIRAQEDRGRYDYPDAETFWPLVTQYFLVKEAPLLQWDFEHPEYGIEASLATLMKTVGMMQKRFRILALNAPLPGHLALPWTSNEYCLLVSVPFIRAMDLSKLEISLLLLQDILRVQEGWLQEQVAPKDLAPQLGSNFFGKKPELAPFYAVAKNYREFIAEKGYSFQQQFQITKKMDALLRPHTELWNGYVRLLGKLDRAVKGNVLFKDYVKLYPSPEMQIRWLAPEEKIP